MVHLRTFGRLELRGQDGREVLAILAQPKRTALLAYLAAAVPHGFHRRDALIALFWPEHDQAHARAALRKAIYSIRQSLGDAVLLGRGEEEIGIGYDALHCDAYAFANAIEQGDDERALELYSGDFLPGFFLTDEREFERWLEQVRTNFRTQAFNAAWRLAERAEKNGDGFGAAQRARQAALLKHDDETALRRLIALLDRIGDRSGAIASYEEFARRLAHDYDLEPSSETQSLIQEIRHRLPKAATAAAVPLLHERHVVTPPADPRSIAVLPFLNLSEDPDNEYFSDGVTEELIHRLSRVTGLRVAARTSSFLFKGTCGEIAEIGRRLNVANLLEGSVRKAGKRIKITAQLIDVSNGFHRWSEVYERQLDDVFLVQAEIAESIAAALRGQLTDRERGVVAERGTHDLQAFEYYMQGRYFWNKRTPPALQRAIACFRDAIARDPGYARAHAGLADSFNQLAVYGFLPGVQGYRHALQAAQTALTLEPALAEAHASLGFALMQHDFDWSGAESELCCAISLDACYAAAHQWYCHLLHAVGRVHEATLELERARELEPLSMAILTDVGRDCYFAREFDCSARTLRAALEIDRSFARGHGALGLALIELGQHAEAIREFELAIELAGGWYPTRWGQGGLARACALSGDVARARDILQQLENAEGKYVSPEVIALVYAALNEPARAIAELERGLKERSINFVFPLRDPAFDSLRGDPAFDDVLARAGLPINRPVQITQPASGGNGATIPASPHPAARRYSFH